jgi:hypothetical protein
MGEMSQLPIDEAWKVTVGSLLWWPDCNLLCQWGRSMVEPLLLLLLLWMLLLELPWLELWMIALILQLLWSMQLTPRWDIHHAGLGRSTTRTTTTNGSRHHPLSLFLIGLSNGLPYPLLINGYTCQLVVRQAREMHQALLQMDGEPCTVQVGLLFIPVDVVCAILSQGVELPHVVEYIVVPLLKVQEILQLAAEQTRR